ncbi:hypothetical protein [Thalassobellus sediminis]|uniref:hypothetical protein n=1 Tax=Thalassobellus sediminis TaxID=3367753 RepID=UPI0037B98A52
MKSKYLLLVLFYTFISNSVSAQNTYDITFPGNDRDKKCQQCIEIFEQKPKEVRFSIKREKNDLYFQINDKNWFDLLFKNAGDGIAIDIVPKSIYDCAYETVADSQIRGFLLKPIYREELKKELKSSGDSFFRVYVGSVPEGIVSEELEYNILFLSNKNLCKYYWLYDLENYSWDLLDMGMYLDSLTYNPKEIKTSAEESYLIRNKILKFKIPFEKNKSNYSQEDIKPIYDSLRLTDFNIKAINIKAYSSVEGHLDRNIELQEQRANSIVAALQKFQKPTIKTSISSSENWVEFLNDIKETEYENLLILNKNQIKEKLVGDLSKKMEPILNNHRKAVVELELEKKDRYKSVTSDLLLKKFNEAINLEYIEEAKEIQNSIFEKLKAKEVSPDILRKMDIPKQEKFVKIFNKNSAYRYMLNERQSLIVYNELLELEKLVPENREVKYNIVVIKLKLWRHNSLEINETKLEKQINVLKSYGIHSSLISRMMVNFHIIKAENLMKSKDYVNKDKSITYINNNYDKFPFSDYDYLSLAQFFSYYANTDLSIKLLEDEARSIDINEDLLFYYLNLTIIDSGLMYDSSYRTIMFNAINMNKERYCKLFNSIEKGGVTFQLLATEYLRKTYCETCKN